jgi:hypothetical protein
VLKDAMKLPPYLTPGQDLARQYWENKPVTFLYTSVQLENWCAIILVQLPPFSGASSILYDFSLISLSLSLSLCHSISLNSFRIVIHPAPFPLRLSLLGLTLIKASVIAGEVMDTQFRVGEYEAWRYCDRAFFWWGLFIMHCDYCSTERSG